MCPYKYYQIMRISKEKKQIRYKMVIYAQEHGNKPTARMYRTSVKTVRKWRKRLKEKGYEGLEELSRKPHYSPKKTDERTREKIIYLRKKYKRIGSKHIQVKHDVGVSVKTMNKICKEANLPSRKRRKKHVTKNNLRNVKKAYKLFEFNMEDTKELYDIPEYWIQMKKMNLPTIQYTFREVSAGIMFLGYADEKSLTYSTLFAEYIQNHLENHNISLSNSVRQTDNGSEYIGSIKATNASKYTKTIESIKGQIHQTIIPGCHRMQSDVETVHDIIEREFFEVEKFYSYENFFDKVYTYQLFFNLERINTYKENKSPYTLAKEKNPSIKKEVFMLPPIDLRFSLQKHIAFLLKGGYDVYSTP
ncbi:MAG: helix-turn-helix domain-containing protein [Candidatus Omnitrophica bacterium]|nr:helix-turn-helix domain-containing protein [Candidatus Omnitrophota bacterium]